MGSLEGGVPELSWDGLTYCVLNISSSPWTFLLGGACLPSAAAWDTPLLFSSNLAHPSRLSPYLMLSGPSMQSDCSLSIVSVTETAPPCSSVQCLCVQPLPCLPGFSLRPSDNGRGAEKQRGVIQC